MSDLESIFCFFQYLPQYYSASVCDRRLTEFRFFLSQADRRPRRVFSAAFVARIFSNTAVCAEAPSPQHCFRPVNFVLKFVLRGVRRFTSVHEDRIF